MNACSECRHGRHQLCTTVVISYGAGGFHTAPTICTCPCPKRDPFTIPLF